MATRRGRVFYHKFQKYALVLKKGDSFTRRGSIKLCVKLAAFGTKKRTKAVGHHRTRVSGSKGAFAKQRRVVGTLYKHLNFLSNRTQASLCRLVEFTLCYLMVVFLN